VLTTLLFASREDEWWLGGDILAALLDTGAVDDEHASGRARTKVLTLEIEPDSDPITGRLSEVGAPEQEFVGWLGLARALELALESRDVAPGP